VTREAIAAVGLTEEEWAKSEAAVSDDDEGVAARNHLIETAMAARENPRFRKLLQVETGTNDDTTDESKAHFNFLTL
jgi:hypothetical protein